MTLKEKIRICFEILFKGRDIKEELNGVERKRIELGERMKEQLELLINDEKPSMVSNPDRSLMGTIQIADIEAAPVSCLRSHLPEPPTIKVHNFRLEIANNITKYAIRQYQKKIQSIKSRINHLCERTDFKVYASVNSLDIADYVFVAKGDPYENPEDVNYP